MISSQLGRMILDNTRASPDEMKSTSEDRIDEIDVLLDEVAGMLEVGRRPEGRSSRAGQRPVSRPSR